MLIFFRAYWVSCSSSRAVCGVWFSLCECIMSSVCDSSVNASLQAPEEMQSAVAVAHLTHPSAHAHFCTHNATLHFCTQRSHGMLIGEREGIKQWKRRQRKEWRMIGRERRMEMESGSNKEIQCENKNEGKSVKDTMHSLSGFAGPLFFPKCCIFTPFSKCPFFLHTFAFFVLMLASLLDPWYVLVIFTNKTDKWRKGSGEGERIHLPLSCDSDEVAGPSSETCSPRWWRIAGSCSTGPWQGCRAKDCM